MALKETLDVIAIFGYVAGIVTAGKLACHAWRLWSPQKTKDIYPPELRAEIERSNRAFDDLKVRTAALLKQTRAPT